MSAAALSPAVAAAEHGRIPVLAIGAYLAGDTGAAAPVARAIARTCEDTGFLVVANHGVPPRLVEDTFAVAVQFFARPEPEKPDSNRLASTGVPDAGGLVFLSGEEEAAIVTGEGRARCQPEGGHTGQ